MSTFEIPKKNYFIHIVSLLLILFVAVILRINVVNNTKVYAPISHDAEKYYSYAMNVKYHGVFSKSHFKPKGPKPAPDAFVSPGYPFFILPFVKYPPSEKMVWNIQRTQVLIGSITVIFIFLLGRYILNPWYALLAAFLTALSPHLIMSSVYVLTETLFTFLMFVSLYFLFRGFQRQQKILLGLGAAFLGMASLTRPSLQYFIIVVIPLIYSWSKPSFKVKNVVVMVFCFFTVLTPWLIRNYTTLGKISDDGLKIATLHHGMYPDMMYKNIPESKGMPYRFDPDIHKFTSDTKSVVKEIIRRFKKDPVRYSFWYIIKKPITLLSWDILAGMGDVFIYPVTESPYFQNGWISTTRKIMKFLHWPLVIMSLFGCLAVWLPPFIKKIDSYCLPFARVLSILMIYFIGLHMVGAPFPRYGIPLRPIIYIQAIFTFRLFQEFMTKRARNK